jgi:hypothetical protein
MGQRLFQLIVCPFAGILVNAKDHSTADGHVCHNLPLVGSCGCIPSAAYEYGFEPST